MPPAIIIAPTAPGTMVTSAAALLVAEVKELVTGVVAVPSMPPFELDRPVLVSVDISDDEELLLAADDDDAAADAELVGIVAPAVTRKDDAVVEEDWACASTARSEMSMVRLRRRMTIVESCVVSPWRLVEDLYSPVLYSRLSAKCLRSWCSSTLLDISHKPR